MNSDVPHAATHEAVGSTEIAADFLETRCEQTARTSCFRQYSPIAGAEMNVLDFGMESDMACMKLRTNTWRALIVVAVCLYGCGDADPVASDRYTEPDRLFAQLEKNVDSSDDLEKLVDIDHSRLGAEAGSYMPPARVLIFSNPGLDAEFFRINPLAALDLPLRVLAYESTNTPGGRVSYNSFDYLRSRYNLVDAAELESLFNAAMAQALDGIASENIESFVDDTMQPDGIVTMTSPYGFESTIDRLTSAIDAQDDTVWFGEVDFRARAKSQGVETGAAVLLLFGAPAPGAKAMSQAPTLGLDAFCQKLLVWEDDDGAVKVSFNDLLALAERHNVEKNIALRVVNRRLKSTFGGALE